MFNQEESVLEIAFHWPIHRLAFGWSVMAANDKYNYHTIELYLGIATVTINIF